MADFFSRSITIQHGHSHGPEGCSDHAHDHADHGHSHGATGGYVPDQYNFTGIYAQPNPYAAQMAQHSTQEPREDHGHGHGHSMIKACAKYTYTII